MKTTTLNATSMKKSNSKNQAMAFVGALFFGTALMSAGAMATDADAKLTAAKSQAESVYDAEIKHCDTLAGNAKDVCVKDAKAKHISTDADAKAKHTAMDAQGEANADKNEANYKAAKERCDTYSGDKKDACVDAAKVKYHQ